MLKRKIRRSQFLERFESSMKMKGMDGPIDLGLYRPIGFLIAWALSFTRIHPNAVTVASALLGFAAGICALPGTPEAFLLCALFYQVSNCFDCADGQLARMTGRYTPSGRVLDGVADYAVNVCVFAGTLAGLVRVGLGRPQPFLLVAAGGAAMAFSCLLYDRAVTRYSKLMRNGPGEEVEEIEQARGYAASSRGIARLAWSLYGRYLKLQFVLGGKASKDPMAFEGEAEKTAYAKLMYPLLMAWSFAGPSAHVLYYLLFALLGKIELFFVAAVLIAAASALILGVQQLVEARLRERVFAKD